MYRKSLQLVLVVLALLASSAALAANKPAVLKHGSFCSYQGQGCKRCTLSNGSSGYASCEIQRCLYNGVWHNHYVNCGNCTTACPI